MTSDGMVFIDAGTYNDVGMRCEAGLFDSSFACDVVNHRINDDRDNVMYDDVVKRYRVGTTNVWLCENHRDVITIKPTAQDDVV